MIKFYDKLDGIEIFPEKETKQYQAPTSKRYRAKKEREFYGLGQFVKVMPAQAITPLSIAPADNKMLMYGGIGLVALAAAYYIMKK